MGNKSSGLNTAKKLRRRRKASKMLDRIFVSKMLGLKKKADPLAGASQAKAIVL